MGILLHYYFVLKSRILVSGCTSFMTMPFKGPFDLSAVEDFILSCHG